MSSSPVPVATRRWLPAVTVLVTLLTAGTANALPSNPLDLPQLTAEAPLRVPTTRSCTEKVLVHLFANSYGSPGYGAHQASACPGPWSFVTLGVEVSVSGVQFDRLFDIYVGHVPLLSSSTSEPASELPGALTHWHVDADVSRFAGLLASDQPITAILNNVNDASYTGQYQVTLTLTYYATSSDAPAILPPDFIAAVFKPGDALHADAPGNLGDSGYTPLRASALSYEKEITLPKNLRSLAADVYAEGHGACEEFWWAEPGQCGVGTPLRQVLLSIDGVIAGFAPVYPTLFTGGGGPGSWEPIPSPRAWHLDAYHLDLTPFVGLLVDGKPHRFKLGVPDAAYSDPGDYWEVGATLLGKTDHQRLQTSGALISMPVAAAETASSTSDPVVGATNFSASRTGEWKGYVTGSLGRLDSTVSNHFDITSQSAVAVNSTWHWMTTSKVELAGAAAATRTTEQTYGLASPGVGGGRFGDNQTLTVTGPKAYQSSRDLQLTTAGAVYANATQAETFDASDSSGYCYDRTINTSSGYVVADNANVRCPASGGDKSGGGLSRDPGDPYPSDTGPQLVESPAPPAPEMPPASPPPATPSPAPTPAPVVSAPVAMAAPTAEATGGRFGGALDGQSLLLLLAVAAGTAQASRATRRAQSRRAI